MYLKETFSICFISADIYPYVNQEDEIAAGGAERQQYLIATELKKRGNIVNLIVGDYGPRRYEQIDGIHVWKGCPESHDDILSLLWKAGRLFKLIKKLDADIYYVRGSPRLFSVVSLFCAVLNKHLIYCIANESDTNPKYLKDRYNRLQNIFYRKMVNWTDLIISQTDEQKGMVKKHLKIQSVVIPNGYNLPHKSSITSHVDRDYVLWVGRSNEEKKKPMRFLDLAEQLSQIPFVIVTQPSNDGSHHREVKQRATSIDNLKFVDTVSPDKVHQYYNMATVLVNTSDYEGFPNTFLEAWRYETPVVSLYYTLDDVFSEAKIGIRSGSKEQLREDVTRLHSDPAKRKTMGKNARRHLKENFLLEDVVDDYETVIRKLLRRKGDFFSKLRN